MRISIEDMYKGSRRASSLPTGRAALLETQYEEGWNDCLDYLHSQGLLMVWNTDMDSAPRDGTSILTLSDWGVCEAWWNGYVWITAVQTGSDEYAPLCCIPTAWMPLPPAPKGNK